MISPSKFDINKKTLEENFRKYQKVIHPDKFISKNDNMELHDKAKEIAITINSAYKF